jgi:hypothetical protein
MAFSYWPNAKDKFNTKAVRYMRVGNDEDLPRIMVERLWSAIVFEPAYRAKVNFKYADWVALDFDDGPTLADIMRRFCDCRCIIGTTKSHQKEKRTDSGEIKPARDRFRMAIQLERRCESREDFEYTTKSLQRRLEADPAATDGARLLFPCTTIVFQNLDEDAERQEIYKAPPRPPKIIPRPAGGRFYKSRLYRMVELFPSSIQNRNTTLFKIGMELRDQGTSPEIIRAEIMRLIPSSQDFTDREKESIFKSVMRHNPS